MARAELGRRMDRRQTSDHDYGFDDSSATLPTHRPSATSTSVQARTASSNARLTSSC
jgi:hypothetical protein